MTHRLKEYNRRKVWTVDTNDVEWITVELKDNGYGAKPTQRKQKDHDVHIRKNKTKRNNIPMERVQQKKSVDSQRQGYGMHHSRTQGQRQQSQQDLR